MMKLFSFSVIFLFFSFKSLSQIPNASKIHIWYGKKSTQQGKMVYQLNFGQTGVPQTWINILGNVSNATDRLSLSYSLNGKKEGNLIIGPDSVRLINKGDFNAEIPVEKLNLGKNTLSLFLKDKNRQVIDNQKIILNFNPKRNLLKDSLVIRWGQQPIENVAQIVDGKWTLENGMVRSSSPGYDRIIAIGDTSWTDYEIQVPVIIHAQNPAFTNPEGGASMGITMRWTGHVAWNKKQPREGWWPYGGVIWYGYEPIAQGINFILQGNRGKDIDKPLPKTWEFGKKYWVKLQGKTIVGQKNEYKSKFWEYDSPEPTNWDVQGEEPINEPNHGSMLFVNHYTDASFGDVIIRKLK